MRWYLHNFRILLPFFVVLTLCSSNIYLHTASHNFPIDIIEVCESPGIKCASLPLSGNWVNYSVYDVFYGRLLPHSNETNVV